MENKEMTTGMENNLTYEQFLEIKKRMDEAENDSTPYAVVENEQIHVVGDVNKTESKKRAYTLTYAFPNTEEWEESFKQDGIEIIRKTDNYLVIDREYNDVWISPRMQTAVMSSFVHLYSFFNIVTDKGEVRDLTEEEIKLALDQLDQDMVEALCHALATVLKVSRQEEECMVVESAVRVLLEMLSDFPELINNVDFFTGNLSETNQ